MIWPSNMYVFTTKVAVVWRSGIYIWNINYLCTVRGITCIRGYIFQKLLLAWNFSCINKNCFFVKETDTFGHIVVWTTYTSHIDHFTPQHTAFELSAACLSVFLELLPGSIPLTMLWHAWWTLDQTICMNVTYNYLTTMFRSIFCPKCTNFW